VRAAADLLVCDTGDVVRKRRRLTREKGLIGLALLCALAFSALALHAATGVTFAVDGSTRDVARQYHHDLVEAGMRTVSMLGTAAVLVPLIGLVSCLAWRRCSVRHAVAVPVAMGGAGALQLVAKWAVDRPRPNLDDWGFPSGHVLIVVVLLGLACHLAAVAGVSRRWRRLAGTTSLAVVVAVAVSRLYLDVHWLSDVMGGFAIGLAYLLVVIAVLDVARLSGRRRLVEPYGADSREASPARCQ
jgi:membrane-associated phospholipid phosphatase